MKYLKIFEITATILLFAMLLLLACSCLIGMGYIINRIYHIELFQSIMIVAIASIGLILFSIKLSGDKIEQCLNERNDSWYDEDDDDVFCPECGEKMIKSEDQPEDENYHETKINVGRNDPCFCGSGIKYKKCCGKIQ